MTEIMIYQRPRGYNKGGVLPMPVVPPITCSDWQNNTMLIEIIHYDGQDNSDRSNLR